MKNWIGIAGALTLLATIAAIILRTKKNEAYQM